MANAVAKQQTPLQSISAFMNAANVKAKFADILGAKAPQFITSVMNAISTNKMLQTASKESIYGSAMMAAVLNLPINQSLGYAYIVPYGRDAQFQMGYKGFIQLAMRSGEYEKINVVAIREGEFEIINPIEEEYKFNKPTSDKIVGYLAYFKLLNGFKKYFYMSKEEIEAHGKQFSKTYNTGVWKSNFDAMAKKTVLKQLLSKYGVLSMEMDNAKRFDQAIVKKSADDSQDIQDDEIVYVDNTITEEEATEALEEVNEKKNLVAEAMKESVK